MVIELKHVISDLSQVLEVFLTDVTHIRAGYVVHTGMFDIVVEGV